MFHAHSPQIVQNISWEIIDICQFPGEWGKIQMSLRGSDFITDHGVFVTFNIFVALKPS